VSTPTPAKVHVLFVCVENANRSQMAEAFARLHGGDVLVASSAGSRPVARVNPRAVRAMRERGYDLSAHRPKSVGEFRGRRVDVAVTMGCGDECPWLDAARRVDWDLPDPRDLGEPEFCRVRDEIERRVRALIADLTPH
jgi:protein-tyrosine-phosphatase